MLENGMRKEWLNLWNGNANEIPINSNILEYCSILSNSSDKYLSFKPPRGWHNHIEINDNGTKKSDII